MATDDPVTSDNSGARLSVIMRGEIHPTHKPEPGSQRIYPGGRCCMACGLFVVDERNPAEYVVRETGLAPCRGPSGVRPFDDPIDLRERAEAAEAERDLAEQRAAAAWADHQRAWDELQSVQLKADGLAVENARLREAGEALATAIGFGDYAAKDRALVRWREMAGDG